MRKKENSISQNKQPIFATAEQPSFTKVMK